MVSSSSEDDFVLSFLKKRKRKEILGPSNPEIYCREEGEFPLLIKEQRDYHGRFKVYFRISVAQFDALLAILEPQIKKKTTNFCELSVQGFLHCFVLQDEGWTWQSPFWILVFACMVALNCQNTSQNACYRCEKCRKSNPSEFFYDGQKFRQQCVNVIDTTWGHIYFSTCESFGRTFQTQCAMALGH